MYNKTVNQQPIVVCKQKFERPISEITMEKNEVGKFIHGLKFNGLAFDGALS